MRPVLSIVCPFYGVEAFLAECLESVRRQTLENFEVILVDDGSLDDSALVAESVAAFDPRFKIVRTENIGLGAARNLGTSHAQGEFITFLDSDDIVAPRGYELLVDSMRHTGSDLAAGNARRFSNRTDVRQSWTHRNAFARTKLATHITELPDLADDRMVWNKVYRRSFWDKHAYRFPAIKYEDYPVTLAAHLAATKVDVHSTPIYYWRERISNDSITQRAFEFDNLRDRARSAHMVLDLLTTDVPFRVSDRVFAHFANVDLLTFAEAMVGADPDECAAVMSLLTPLARRVHIRPSTPVQRLAKLVHAKAAEGELQTVLALATWRKQPSAMRLLRDLSLTRDFPLLAAASRSVGNRYKLVDKVAHPRVFKGEVTNIEPQNEGMLVHLVMYLREQFNSRAKLEIALVAPGFREPLGFSTNRVDNKIHAKVVVPYNLFQESPDAGRWSLPDAVNQIQSQFVLEISASLGPVRWQGDIIAKKHRMPGIVQMPDGAWLQAGRSRDSWFLMFWRIEDPVVITDARLDGEALALRLNREDGQVELDVSPPSLPLVATYKDGWYVFDLASLIEADPLDNPLGRAVYRRLQYRIGPNRHHIHQPELIEPAEHGDWTIDLWRTQNGTAEVVRRRSVSLPGS